jgi:hypothetical protein
MTPAVGTVPRAAEGRGTVRDLRGASRWFAAIVMPVGPAAVAVLRFALPYNTNDSASVAVAKIAAHAGRERLALGLFALAIFTLVPGALAAIRLASRRAPVLAAISALLLVPGYLAIFGVALIDQVGITAANGSVSTGTVGQVATLVNDLPTTSLYSVVFVGGHIIGSILLAVALRRSRRVGLAGCLILGISQPLHVASVISGNHLLDLIGWGMTAVGMAFAARALVALSDDEWDLPPERP